MTEGYIPFNDFRTYYKAFGTASEQSIPIVVLQGGPGVSHHYMLGLRKLAGNNQRVIFYDQFGSGQSDGWDRPDLWSIETFVDQLDKLRQALGLQEVHLVGHSFGGMLAIDYLLSKPSGVKSVTLSSTMISMPLYQQEVDGLIAKLPASSREVIKRSHAKGAVDNDVFTEAFRDFNNQHVFRGNKWPEDLNTPKGMRNEELYRNLWGLSEAYTLTGSLRDWDRLDRLHEIDVPTLITAGEYDELTPSQAKLTSNRITGSRLKIFENCSHCHHVENEEGYLSELTNFLKGDVH